ncbi:putative disease resistance protein At4g19050 [Syzygium oleosum]|uniref:putative disease resistance protein At4g19050 n=1 Tax=Syzygium oleosum TaxID=219896 RepID=UPI0024B9221D|nr:putative disease resistance protein At4g19050 [Syzygium oleosum]
MAAAAESGQSPLPADSLEALKQEILAFLMDDKVKIVVLSGETGVGKTWMAREVSNSYILKVSSCKTLWMVLRNKYEERAFLEDIAIQLSVLPSNEEWEGDDKNAEKEQEEEKELESLKQEIRDKLEATRPAESGETEEAKSEWNASGKPDKKATVKVDQKKTKKKPYLLVILDDITDEDQEKIVTALDSLLHDHLLKVLITRRGSDIDAGSEGIRGTIPTEDGKIISCKIKFLSDADSSNLLKNRVKEEVSSATGFKRLSDAIGGSTSGRPGIILMIAEALNRVEDLKLDNAVEEAASVVESADITRLLKHVLDMLPSTLSKFYWHCRYLFRECSGIHYNELITHWLLEGYFDNHDHIEKAYEEAHCTLMDLKVRGFLREKANNYVHMESDALKFPDLQCHGFDGSSRLGMATVLKDKKWAGLGRVAQTDGMIKTNRGGGMISTLLIEGARLFREVPERFFRPMEQLKILVILNPKFKHIPSPLSMLKELQVLVLRGCNLLEKVDEIHELTKLLVLEISGACLITNIQEDLFKQMEELTSLNLSEVGIESLPSSVLNRSKLRWLILRKCPNLKEFYGLKSLENLEVLDLSGSFSFKRIRDKTLAPLEKIQTLNLSQTKIDRLPIFHKLGGLTRLLVSDCPSLARLPSLQPLTRLEILDLSGATSLEEIQDDSLDGPLRILNLSGSAVNKLPEKISNLSHLLLSRCHSLECLPSTQNLNHLEELDLSNAIKFVNFNDDSFKHLKSLRRFILSESKIKSLPSFPDHSELRFLLLIKCKSLTEVQNLSVLKKLEALDLSGCSELVLGQNESFKHMSHLMMLNLSETKVESLRSDCFPSSLRRLIMRNCTRLKDLPSLEALSNLEELDLCGAESLSNIKVEFLQHSSKLRILNLSKIKFKKLPSVSHLTNLRELSLRGGFCKVSDLEALKELEQLDLSETEVESLQFLETFSNLRRLLLRKCAGLKDLKFFKSLRELEVLDLSGTNIEDYPYEISDLSGLCKLDLQVMKHAEEIDWKKIKYVPDKFNLKCCGSGSPEKSDSDSTGWPSISTCGTQFLQFLEGSNLWNIFQKFHICVWLSKELPQERDKRMFHRLGDIGILRDMNSQGRIPRHKEPQGFLEIHGPFGSSSLPKVVLKHADHISLIDTSISHLSELGEEFLESIKSFWLERCTEICSIVDVEDNARVLGNLNSLYLCNLISLRSVCSDNFQSESDVFLQLESLYIEYCPMLTNIFQLSKPPKNLKTLQVKFCDELKELFKPHAPAECKLRTLDLMELPKLERIGVTMASLQELKVRWCPNLNSLEETLGEAKILEVLYISGAAKLETLCSQKMKPDSFKNLKQLKIESCPKLKEVSSSSHSPPNLEIVKVKSCYSLETIFGGRSAAGTSLPRLQVQLCDLPELKSTGFKVPRQSHVVNCQKLPIG